MLRHLPMQNPSDKPFATPRNRTQFIDACKKQIIFTDKLYCHIVLVWTWVSVLYDPWPSRLQKPSGLQNAFVKDVLLRSLELRNLV